jgi:hypothetical protein
MMNWMIDVLKPAIDARFHGHPEIADTMEESYKLFGTAPGQKAGLIMIQNTAQIDKDIAIRHAIDPGAAYQGMIGKDYQANLDALGASIQNFGQAVGSPAVASAIGYMQQMSGVIGGIADQALKHPTAAKGTTDVLEGLLLGGLGAGAWKLAGKALGGIGLGESGISGLLAPLLGVAGKLIWPAAVLTTIDRILGEQGLKKIDENTPVIHTPEAKSEPTVSTPAFKSPAFGAAMGTYGYTDSSLKSEMDREAARAKALSAMTSIGNDIQGAIQKIPGQVAPAIASLAGIGSSLAAAISAIAASARAAAAAIPTSAGQTTIHTQITTNLDGRTVAENSAKHYLRASKLGGSSGIFDVGSYPSPIDAVG